VNEHVQGLDHHLPTRFREGGTAGDDRDPRLGHHLLNTTPAGKTRRVSPVLRLGPWNRTFEQAKDMFVRRLLFGTNARTIEFP